MKTLQIKIHSCTPKEIAINIPKAIFQHLQPPSTLADNKIIELFSTEKM